MITKEERNILIESLEERISPYIARDGMPSDVKRYSEYGHETMNSMILLKILKEGEVK